MCVCYDGNDSFDHRKRDQIRQSEKGNCVYVCVHNKESIVVCDCQ